MVSTKRGRAYTSIIPADRLLLETDAPVQKGEQYNAVLMRAELEALIVEIAALRRLDPQDIANRIQKTSQQILSIT